MLGYFTGLPGFCPHCFPSSLINKCWAISQVCLASVLTASPPASPRQCCCTGWRWQCWWFTPEQGALGPATTGFQVRIWEIRTNVAQTVPTYARVSIIHCLESRDTQEKRKHRLHKCLFLTHTNVSRFHR